MAIRPGAKPLQEREPVHDRHRQIEEDHLGPRRDDAVEPDLAVLGLDHDPTVLLQKAAKPGARVVVVVDHQHRSRGGRNRSITALNRSQRTGFNT